MRYADYAVVFAEFPDETTLALNLTGCPNRCPGCHSPWLQRDEGQTLDEAELQRLLDRYGRAVTCIGFMGGDADPAEVARLAAFVRRTVPALRIGWYSGCERNPEAVDPELFDYVKSGPWVEALGPLTSPTTNQRLYRLRADGRHEDLTGRFRRSR